MPNANYNAGRRFEYERIKHYRDTLKWDVWRSAGSHGPFDITCVSAGGDVTFIQCKVVATKAAADRLIDEWHRHPPLGYRGRGHYHQRLDIKVKGSKEILYVIA